MPGSGQGNASGLGGSGVAPNNTSPWSSALQGATNGVGWVGQHIPFIHHGGQTPQAPMPGTGQGTSGTPQYDSYGRIVGYSPTQTNDIPTQPNMPSFNGSALWNLLSQMGVFNGQVQAPAGQGQGEGGAPSGTMGGSVQSPQQNNQFLHTIASILGIQIPTTDNSPKPTTPSVPTFGPNALPGMFNDGQGGLTYSKSADENNQYGYWGKEAYAGGGTDMEKQMAAMFAARPAWMSMSAYDMSGF